MRRDDDLSATPVHAARLAASRFFVKAAPGCSRRRNVLYPVSQVVLAGCMKAVYLWMLRHSCHRLGSTVAGAVSPQNLPGSPGEASQAVFLLGVLAWFLPARGSPGRQAQGVGSRPLCSGHRVGVSVLLVRVIPAIWNGLEPPAGFRGSLWGCSRTFRPSGLDLGGRAGAG